MIADRHLRAAKIARIRDGNAPRLLELCAGCGGMALGLEAAGFEAVAHVEVDATAAASYALNFVAPTLVDGTSWASARNMNGSDLASICGELGLAGGAGRQFDVLAAGLPCQAFARIGRSKLRSLTGDAEAFRNDPRARLYTRFLRYVEAVQPVAIILENVPDILNFGGHNVPEEICATLAGMGYVARYTLLNAAFYGVPQMRERLFLIAIDASLGTAPGFPAPSRSAALPPGYEGARTVALRHVPAQASNFVRAPVAGNDLPVAVTTGEALADLPRIEEHLHNPDAMRRRRTSDVLPYSASADPSAYVTAMCAWRRPFAVQGGSDGHVVRLTPRDFEIFRRMRNGGDYPHANSVAMAIFEEQLARACPRPAEGSPAYEALRKRCVPPYDPGKFPNKWWKLVPTLPSRTLTAHMGKDTYSHIHWDSDQMRTITVREAARLQSFPDSFRFAGAMNAAFRQIGNAVPPLLARAIGLQVLLDLQFREAPRDLAPAASRPLPGAAAQVPITDLDAGLLL